MDYYARVLITIVCESVLEEKIIESAKKLGALGYTVLEARGEGARGAQSGDFEYNKNIKIEILCQVETADEICEEVRKKYFANYAVILYRSDVSVMRNEKFN